MWVREFRLKYVILQMRLSDEYGEEFTDEAVDQWIAKFLLVDKQDVEKLKMEPPSARHIYYGLAIMFNLTVQQIGKWLRKYKSQPGFTINNLYEYIFKFKIEKAFQLDSLDEKMEKYSLSNFKWTTDNVPAIYKKLEMNGYVIPDDVKGFVPVENEEEFARHVTELSPLYLELTNN